jgi:hypothetical protein
MRKIILLVMLVFPLLMKAQDLQYIRSVDSNTYQCYLSGDWDRLLALGKQALENKTDFKYLRQRMGFAYFMKADYYASQKQYEKALAYNDKDPVTLEYLYYCGINTGNDAYSRFRAARLSTEQKKRLNIHVFEPFASIGIEYNYKDNNSSTRSNPSYYRVGLYSQLGYRVSLYQSASNYKQVVDSTYIKQPDYFALLNWSVTSHILFSVAYHHLNTSLDGYKYPGNLGFASLSTHINRLSLGANGSYFKYDLGDFKQVGVHAGVTLPGRANIYFTSLASGLIEKQNNRMVYAEYAGGRVYKTLWAEGNVIIGNIQNYNDNNALYIYNSIDPTLFRAGISLFWHADKTITLYCNYHYETKQLEQTTERYIQQSFLAGIIWKP